MDKSKLGIFLNSYGVGTTLNSLGDFRGKLQHPSVTCSPAARPIGLNLPKLSQNMEVAAFVAAFWPTVYFIVKVCGVEKCRASKTKTYMPSE